MTKNTSTKSETAAKYVTTVKPARTWATSKRRWVIWSSPILLALIALLFAVPNMSETVQREAAARAFVIAIANGYHEAMAEEVRVLEEAAVMKEFNALRVTLYCEASKYDKQDMLAIADNVFSRIDSPAYPDTVYDVVNEVRTSAETGKKVAMYSYIFTDCPSTPKMTGKWRLSGRMAAIALKQRWDGQASSGSVNYHAPYVNPVWATTDVNKCLLKPLGERGFHLHYAAVPVSERANCLAERKLASQVAAANAVKAIEVATTVKWSLPKVGPVPAQRPDDIASVILAMN